jgi:hypothetical protein
MSIPRRITDHHTNGLNELVAISAMDEPGPGGANHLYHLDLIVPAQKDVPWPGTIIRFQKGGIQEAGPNGLTNEALLAVVIDRLRGFQAGKFNCEETEVALLMATCCLKVLSIRTKWRLQRGVEGQAKA